MRCTRCGKRCRNYEGWNSDWIAGMEVGLICPGCQTAEEDLGAQIREVLDPPSQWSSPPSGREGIVKVIDALARQYPTPIVMRHKADLLIRARKDGPAQEIVRLMRTIADSMETGELWDEGPPDFRFAQCVRCYRLAPTTQNDFQSWSAGVDVNTGEAECVTCPDCIKTAER
jgi:hypothetical protein